MPLILALQRQRQDFCVSQYSHSYIERLCFKKTKTRGWGFSSVVESLPSKCKALGPQLRKKKKKKEKKTTTTTTTKPTKQTKPKEGIHENTFVQMYKISFFQ